MKINNYVDDTRAIMDPEVQVTLSEMVLKHRGYVLQDVEEVPFHWVAKTMNGDFTPHGLQGVMCEQLSAKFDEITIELKSMNKHEAQQALSSLFKAGDNQLQGTTKALHDFYFQMIEAPSLPESTWLSSWNKLAELTRSVRKVHGLAGRPSPLGSNAQLLWEENFAAHPLITILDNALKENENIFARLKSALHIILSHYAQVLAIAHLIPAEKNEPSNPGLRSRQDEVQGWHTLMKPYLVFTQAIK